jgi:hypothetical protein
MNLKAVENRVIVLIDIEGKNSYRFENGTVIRFERNWDTFDQKHTQPVNATVIDAKNIPIGAEILVHHNSCHPVNEVFNHSFLSGEQIASGIKVFSIPETDCYVWRISEPEPVKIDGKYNYYRQGGEWQPLPGFILAERVYEPYRGIIEGIEPKLLKQRLYIKTGELKGNVVITLKAADYQITFQDSNGRENRLIRCRHFEGDWNEREEIIAIDHYNTERLLNGELLIGLESNNAKKIEVPRGAFI